MQRNIIFCFSDSFNEYCSNSCGGSDNEKNFSFPRHKYRISFIFLVGKNIDSKGTRTEGIAQLPLFTLDAGGSSTTEIKCDGTYSAFER